MTVTSEINIKLQFWSCQFNICKEKNHSAAQAILQKAQVWSVKDNVDDTQRKVSVRINGVDRQKGMGNTQKCI